MNTKTTQIKYQNEHRVAAGQIEAALRQHWAASAAGNQEVEHEIYDEQMVCDYPQSGERIHGNPNHFFLPTNSTSQQIPAPTTIDKPP